MKNKRYVARITIWDLMHDCEVAEYSKEFDGVKKNLWATLHELASNVCEFLKANRSYLC